MNPPASTLSWKKLRQHVQVTNYSRPHPDCSEGSLTALHALNTEYFQASTPTISLDYKHQLIDDSAFEMLIALANECHLKTNIESMFLGSSINTSENKPALHTALRVFSEEPIVVNGHNIIPEVLSARERMFAISNQIRQGLWLGYTGKPITDVVNIGIGGSHLGPQFCVNALLDFTTDSLKFHFISDFDPNSFRRLTAKLNPQTTLFIAASKSFTTIETIHNTKKAMEWLGQAKYNDKHFIAITANSAKAHALGITNVLPIWDWVGGRFSLCSAINLITCIAIGPEHFLQLLAGAHSMDDHFCTNEFVSNIPVLLALFGIWNINFLDINNLLMLIYTQDLEHLIPYLQQLDMESNGKSVNKQGQLIDYATSPIVWGGLGNQVQHSYYQLLGQGKQKFAADFISVDAYNGQEINKVCYAKKILLSHGTSDAGNPYAQINGYTPINHIRINELTPKAIGSLIAMYEHKIFTQSVLWNINPFDQPGVESMKQLFKNTHISQQGTLTQAEELVLEND